MANGEWGRTGGGSLLLRVGLLERAISRCIREHKISTVPTIGEVWAAVRRELGNPHGDILGGIEHWRDTLWARVIIRF